MTLKEKFLEAKRIFLSETPVMNEPAPAEAATEQKYAEVKMEDGTVLTVDPALEVGAKCMVGDMPVSDGKYKVTDADGKVSMIDVVGGAITEIEAIEEMPEPAASADPVTQPAIAPVQPPVSEETMKQLNKFQQMLEAMEANQKKHEAFSAKMIELMEEMLKQPAADPVTVPENNQNKFRSAKESRILEFAENLKKIKNK